MFILGIILNLSISLFIFFSSIILMIKKYKGVLLYLIFTFDLFLLFFNTFIAVNILPGLFYIR